MTEVRKPKSTVDIGRTGTSQQIIKMLQRVSGRIQNPKVRKAVATALLAAQKRPKTRALATRALTELGFGPNGQGIPTPAKYKAGLERLRRLGLIPKLRALAGRTARKLSAAEKKLQETVNNKLKNIDPVKVAVFMQKYKDKLKRGKWTPAINRLFCKEVLGIDVTKLGKKAIGMAIRTVQRNFPGNLKEFGVDGKLGPETMQGLLNNFAKNPQLARSTRQVMDRLSSGKVKLNMAEIQKQLKKARSLDEYLKDGKLLNQIGSLLGLKGDALKKAITAIFLKKFNVADAKELKASDKMTLRELIGYIMQYVDNPKDFEVLKFPPYFLGFRIIERNKPSNYLIGVEDKFKLRTPGSKSELVLLKSPLVPVPGIGVPQLTPAIHYLNIPPKGYEKLKDKPVNFKLKVKSPANLNIVDLYASLTKYPPQIIQWWTDVDKPAWGLKRKCVISSPKYGVVELSAVALWKPETAPPKKELPPKKERPAIIIPGTPSSNDAERRNPGVLRPTNPDDRTMINPPDEYTPGMKKPDSKEKMTTRKILFLVKPPIDKTRLWRTGVFNDVTEKGRCKKDKLPYKSASLVPNTSNAPEHTMTAKAKGGECTIPLPHGYVATGIDAPPGAKLYKDANNIYRLTWGGDPKVVVNVKLRIFKKDVPLETNPPGPEEKRDFIGGMDSFKYKPIIPASGSNLEKAKALKRYILDNTYYSDGHKGASNYYKSQPNYFKAMEDRKFAKDSSGKDMMVADCDVANMYFIGLCRKAGVPARLAVGYDARSKIGCSQSHAKAEIWDGSKWIPIDATPTRPLPEKQRIKERVPAKPPKITSIDIRKAGNNLNVLVKGENLPERMVLNISLDKLAPWKPEYTLGWRKNDFLKDVDIAKVINRIQKNKLAVLKDVIKALVDKELYRKYFDPKSPLTKVLFAEFERVKAFEKIANHYLDTFKPNFTVIGMASFDKKNSKELANKNARKVTSKFPRGVTVEIDTIVWGINPNGEIVPVKTDKQIENSWKMLVSIWNQNFNNRKRHPNRPKKQFTLTELKRIIAAYKAGKNTFPVDNKNMKFTEWDLGLFSKYLSKTNGARISVISTRQQGKIGFKFKNK